MAQLDIVQLPARSDNFAVLLHDPETGLTASVDAPDADVVVAELGRRGWRLSHILVTHKHADHIAGIPVLKQDYGAEVIGPQRSAAETGLYDRTVGDGDRFAWAGRRVEVIATPGHTLDHVAYFLPDDGVAFVGDTLFAMGCGRVFEGTPELMWGSLLRLRDLPPDTEVYCGHEYTLSNARFAVTVDPGNKALAERRGAEGRATLPTTIGREILTNPFLRADRPAVATTVGLRDAAPAAVFAEIRQRKDRF